MALVLALHLLLASYSDYCDGWESGYKAGWCGEAGYCVEPVVPVCPVPHVGHDSYADGYRRGLLVGMSNHR
jgi:hypothetical protein